MLGAAVSMLVGCSAPEDPNTFVIEGQLVCSEDKPIADSTILYLVPVKGPHPRPVDSVYVCKDGRFRFEGNVEQMAVLRLAWRVRYGTQELLVCTEPGTIHVTLGEKSSSYGTPQNDSLQAWKERTESFRSTFESFRQIWKMDHDTVTYRKRMDEETAALGLQNYQMLKGMGRTTASIFINKMMGGKLDSLKRAELNALLIDTIDYSKPQPGFRK